MHESMAFDHTPSTPTTPNLNLNYVLIWKLICPNPPYSPPRYLRKYQHFSVVEYISGSMSDPILSYSLKKVYQAVMIDRGLVIQNVLSFKWVLSFKCILARKQAQRYI